MSLCLSVVQTAYSCIYDIRTNTHIHSHNAQYSYSIQNKNLFLAISVTAMPEKKEIAKAGAKSKTEMWDKRERRRAGVTK